MKLIINIVMCDELYEVIDDIKIYSGLSLNLKNKYISSINCLCNVIQSRVFDTSKPSTLTAHGNMSVLLICESIHFHQI
jgi:hypothetical protein